MTLIQIDLTDAQDKKVDIYRAVHSLKSKAEAIAAIIEEYKAKL
jgi:Protein of unknown function (DUF2683)